MIKSMENAFSLKGKNAIVTGGAKGIGLGIATALAQQGANVAIFARDEKTANDVIKDFSAKYEGRFSFYKADISDMKSCRDAVSRYIADNKTIDVLVNNAGIGTAGKFLDMDEELTPWFECFNVDLHGAARMIYNVARHMRDSGKGGHIINITSNAGEIINKPFLTAYASSKAAFNHFTKCLAAEFAPYGIRVNAIAPGFTFSSFSKNVDPEAYKALCADIPIGRFADPIELGALAVYLASDASDIVTGAVFTADGGYALQH
ncbi:Enoyl-(Acyl carrier protein) reductase [Sporobacter termitidis DSM 10068]|uniref:Enoyl-(Acyl carrier protein) reductase n=1 Tax=Sporobacter termitidis DSM 10068 TaxID=1123282 RepID=A0A1M5TA26_9FIRM|nr:SDR family oxidoreductase [Sporobacter termitidis]SHH47635.1 Enoyl-(Acyl carrier protein) reductase [Sporobacter termitidis DSM 10068]